MIGIWASSVALRCKELACDAEEAGSHTLVGKISNHICLAIPQTESPAGYSPLSYKELGHGWSD